MKLFRKKEKKYRWSECDNIEEATHLISKIDKFSSWGNRKLTIKKKTIYPIKHLGQGHIQIRNNNNQLHSFPLFQINNIFKKIKIEYYEK